MSDYYERMAELLGVDDKLVSAAVTASTGRQVTTLTRILAGESNAVFRVVLDNGAAVIARQHLADEPYFEKEVGILSALHRRGLPVAEVLGLHHETTAEGTFSTCVLAELSGTSYETSLQSLTAAEHQLITDQCAELLAAIHEIRPVDLAEVPIAQASRLDLAQNIAEALLRAPDFSPDERRVLERTRQAIELREHDTQPHLVHGDFHPKHILVEDLRVVGVLDFEIAELSDPHQDYGWWEFWRYLPKAGGYDLRYPALRGQAQHPNDLRSHVSATALLTIDHYRQMALSSPSTTVVDMMHWLVRVTEASLGGTLKPDSLGR